MSTAIGISCRHAFSETLLAQARMDPSIVVVTSDARGSATLGAFEKELPMQFVEVGIAEQNAVGIGAGLSRSGKRSFVCGPACFYTARALEQLKNDVAYAGANVKVIGVSGGVSYGALGSTHHALHDIAVLRAIPDIAVILPADVYSTRLATEFLSGYDGPAYMRLGRGAVPDLYHEEFEFRFGKAHVIGRGTDILLIATGETVYHAKRACEILSASGIDAGLIDVHTLKPFDEETVLDAASRVRAVLTVEEHSIHGGLGSAVAETLAQHLPLPMKIVGFPDRFSPSGEPHELFDWAGINAVSIAEQAKILLQRTDSRTARPTDRRS